VAGAGEANGSPLVVGVPTEIKDDERRVAITPDGVAELRAEGVPVLVETGAGRGSAIPDEAFRAAGPSWWATPTSSGSGPSSCAR
jgi:alanine dehydrogenase